MQSKESDKNNSVKTTEPSTILLDKGSFFRILVELPDMAEEKIRIYLENHATLVTIIASDVAMHFKKEIVLSCEVRLCKKKFSDGVLELILEKKNTDPFTNPDVRSPLL